MITKRILPCLDVDKGRVVKGKTFTNLKDVDDPVRLARDYSEAGADELVFYDITASNESRNIFLDVVEKTAQEVYIPFTVGGGIRTLEDITAILRAGADKVSINSGAVRDPGLINRAAMKFGRQCVVLSMDVKKTSQGAWTVFVNGGRVSTGKEAISWAREGERLGAGEIVLNCIDADGVKNGYCLDITKAVAEAVNIPVVASGGAGKMEDFLDVFTLAQADAALAASVFHYDDIGLAELKDYLYSHGISVRRVVNGRHIAEGTV